MNKIIFVLIAAYAATGKMGVDPFIDRHQFFKWYLVPMMTLSCIVLLSVFAHLRITERIKAESEFKMIKGQRNVAFLNDYFKLCPLLLSNEQFLFDYSKILSRNGRYADSNAILRQGTLISNDPMFYVIQGNNYKKMGIKNEAEKAYIKAFDIMPNRLYPLYQLMLLYEEEANEEKSADMARRVLGFNEKVVSSATKEMKREANRICKSIVTK